MKSIADDTTKLTEQSEKQSVQSVLVSNTTICQENQY